MTSVDIRVGHDDHLVVAGLVDLELVVADATTDRGNQGLHLEVLQHLVDAGLLDVQELAADRKDRLRRGITRLDRGTTGRIALDDEQLGVLGRCSGRAVAELVRHTGAFQRRLPAGEVARFLGGQPRT